MRLKWEESGTGATVYYFKATKRLRTTNKGATFYIDIDNGQEFKYILGDYYFGGGGPDSTHRFINLQEAKEKAEELLQIYILKNL